MIPTRNIIHLAKMTSVAGMENHLLALLPGLCAQGIEASIIVLTEPDKPMTGYLAEMQRLGVPAESLTIQRDFDPALIRQLTKIFRERRPDAIHTHLIHADLHGLIAAKLAGVRKIFSTGHNDDGFRKLFPVRIFQALFWRQVSGGIAISNALREFLLHTEFAPPKKIKTVHYGLDPDTITFDPAARAQLRAELGISDDTPLIGSVCRLTGQKGLSYAIDAFPSVLAESPNAHYAIIGDGPLRDELTAQVDRLNLSQRIHFLGWRTNARGWMPAFDALLMPSLWEGFGLVALEAMAAQLPVIASRISALPEIIVEGETGYLVPVEDSVALATCMIRLLKNLDQAGQMGKAGRRRLESVFTVDRMVNGTLKVYGNT